MRRILTAREQVEMMSPWRREAMPELYRGLVVPSPVDLEGGDCDPAQELVRPKGQVRHPLSASGHYSSAKELIQFFGIVLQFFPRLQQRPVPPKGAGFC